MNTHPTPPPHPPEDDPRASSALIVGMVGMILLLALVIGAIVLYQSAQRQQVTEKVYAPRIHELAQIRSEQAANISTYRYVDRQQGLVAIPIDVAIELYVKEVNPQKFGTDLPTMQAIE